MWQTAIVMLIVAGFLVHVIRHYAKVYRGESSGCSSCPDGCCPSRGKIRHTSVDGELPIANSACCPSGQSSSSEQEDRIRS